MWGAKAAGGAVVDLGLQGAEQAAGMRKDVDWGRTAFAAALGSVGAPGVGAAAPGLGQGLAATFGPAAVVAGERTFSEGVEEANPLKAFVGLFYGGGGAAAIGSAGGATPGRMITEEPVAKRAVKESPPETIWLKHGSTLKRIEGIAASGPKPDFVEPNGTRAGDFSMAPEEGPYPFGSPERYAAEKAAIYPDEGGPAVLRVEVPYPLYRRAAREPGQFTFEEGEGLGPLMKAWPKLRKEIVQEGGASAKTSNQGGEKE
jgi:hypothetical protein